MFTKSNGFSKVPIELAITLPLLALLGCSAGRVGTAEETDPSSGGGKPPSGEPCSASTCETLGLKCGQASDGCGKQLECGRCDPSCVNNVWFYGTGDADNDGYLKVDSNIFVKGCTAPEPYTQRVDCDDANAGVYLTRILYKDQDGDGFGYGGQIPVCVSTPEQVAAGYSANDLDCDDSQQAITTQDALTVYIDNDHDGHGAGEAMKGCPSSSRSLDNTDCDDNNGVAFVTRQFYVDADHDGYGTGGLVNVCWNNSSAPTGYSVNNTDCNDANGQATTLRSFYYDGDGDGHGTGAALGQECVSATGLPPNRAPDNTDCNDSDPSGWVWRTFYPQDNDLDGFGVGKDKVTACTGDAPSLGGTRDGGDCNDSDARVFPGQTQYFATPSFGGSFDFNCDGNALREKDTNAICYAPSGAYNGKWSEGWEPRTPPCGALHCWATYGTYWDCAGTKTCVYQEVRCR